MSTHKVEVVRVGEITKHPNADSLGLVQIWGFTAIVRLGDFQPGDLAVYIEPDYVVPEGGPFAFLGDKRRIKAKRLRGTWSQGLLIHAPEGAAVGDDLMEQLGITRYEPPMQFGTDSDAERPCAALAYTPKFDVESLRRYLDVFAAGEPVVVTEKIHGASAKYAFCEDRMWCGSRTQWKREEGKSIWWRALVLAPWVETWCRANEDRVLYGEVFGQVQDLKYGAENGEVFFRAFDVLEGNRWLDSATFRAALPDPLWQAAPVVYEGGFDFAALQELSRGDSRIAAHLMEGIVVRPFVERTHPEIGRVCLKLVSDRYLERA